MKLDQKSLRELERKLRRACEAAVQGGSEALHEYAKHIMGVSQEQVPTATGTLKASNFIDDPVREGDEVRVRLGYGGEADQQNPKTGQMASEYMVWVHENLDAEHPIGKAKFLEDPVMESIPELGAKVAMGVREKMARVLKR